MRAIDRERCEYCRFAGESVSYDNYPCLRRAPVMEKVHSSEDVRVHVPRFPIMRGDNWCGEFERKPDPKERPGALRFMPVLKSWWPW